MPVENPDYKENWEELSEQHRAENERLEPERVKIVMRENELAKDSRKKGTSFYDSPEFLELRREQERIENEQKHHVDEMCRCVDTYQHKTIQDAAQWLLSRGTLNTSASQNNLIHQVDFEQFTTMDEVFEAYSKASKATKQIEAEQRSSLPVGKPNNSDIFTDIGENKITSSWQVFDASTMGYSPGVTNNWHSHTLVTVDQREGEYHICFMHDPDIHRGGGSPMNFIEDLSSTMYRRALALHETNKKPVLSFDKIGFSVKGLLSSIMKSASSFINDDDKPRPEQFNFYVHVRPQPTMEEIFCRVDMQFDGNSFRDPDFNHFEVIPEIVQQAFHKENTISNDPASNVVLEHLKR